MIDDVGALMREAATTAILPMFRRLDASDVREKAPGELVTVADQRAEEILSAGLHRLLPGSTVVGEEGAAADGSVLDRLTDDGPVWVVDPIDGTANFAAGHRPFAVMVALLRGRRTAAAWILDPVSDSLLAAEAGSGTFADGVRVRTTEEALPPDELRGVVMTRFLPSPLRESSAAGVDRIGEVLPGQHCAGNEYRDVVTGAQHFAFFWRTLPWDHAPGVLLVQEAGGVARRLDGSAYDPTDNRTGLLVAANGRIWDTLHETVFAAG